MSKPGPKPYVVPSAPDSVSGAALLPEVVDHEGEAHRKIKAALALGKTGSMAAAAREAGVSLAQIENWSRLEDDLFKEVAIAARRELAEAWHDIARRAGDEVRSRLADPERIESMSTRELLGAVHLASQHLPNLMDDNANLPTIVFNIVAPKDC